MDLTKFDVRSAANTGADLHLKHPATGELLFCKDGETPFVVRVLGRDSDAVQAASRECAKRRTKGEIDEAEAGAIVLVAAVCGWSDEMELDGEPLPYSPENAKKLMVDPRTDWIAEQVTPFSLGRKNYAQNMSGN